MNTFIEDRNLAIDQRADDDKHQPDEIRLNIKNKNQGSD